MSAKAILEAQGKSLMVKFLENSNYVKNKFAVVNRDTNWDELEKQNPWLKQEVRCVYLLHGLWINYEHFCDQLFVVD